jgi:hypothetical protein
MQGKDTTRDSETESTFSKMTSKTKSGAINKHCMHEKCQGKLIAGNNWGVHIKKVHERAVLFCNKDFYFCGGEECHLCQGKFPIIFQRYSYLGALILLLWCPYPPTLVPLPPTLVPLPPTLVPLPPTLVPLPPTLVPLPHLILNPFIDSASKSSRHGVHSKKQCRQCEKLKR